MIVSATVLALGALAASADDSPKPESTILVQSTETWDGVELTYPGGQPEITVARIKIPAGVSLPMHCHPMPLAGAVVSGKLKVVTKVGEARTFEEGDGVIEVVNTWHQGTALEDTDLIVVYVGALGLPTHVNEDGDPELTQYCK
jgi:quercetin dioxygenase-like cupin family protein